MAPCPPTAVACTPGVAGASNRMTVLPREIVSPGRRAVGALISSPFT